MCSEDLPLSDSGSLPGRQEAAQIPIAMTLPTPPVAQIDLREQSPLALAFVGDAVLSLLVRAQLASTAHLPLQKLHDVACRYVSAHAQNQELRIIESFLTPEEQAVLRRGRNAGKATSAKHATAQEYHASTGLECLLGWLYLQGRNDRIAQLFTALWESYDP